MPLPMSANDADADIDAAKRKLDLSALSAEELETLVRRFQGSTPNQAASPILYVHVWTTGSRLRSSR
jgi:hypothetical protein